MKLESQESKSFRNFIIIRIVLAVLLIISTVSISFNIYFALDHESIDDAPPVVCDTNLNMPRKCNPKCISTVDSITTQFKTMELLYETYLKSPNNKFMPGFNSVRNGFILNGKKPRNNLTYKGRNNETKGIDIISYASIDREVAEMLTFVSYLDLKPENLVGLYMNETFRENHLYETDLEKLGNLELIEPQIMEIVDEEFDEYGSGSQVDSSCLKYTNSTLRQNLKDAGLLKHSSKVNDRMFSSSEKKPTVWSYNWKHEKFVDTYETVMYEFNNFDRNFHLSDSNSHFMTCTISLDKCHQFKIKPELKKSEKNILEHNLDCRLVTKNPLGRGTLVMRYVWTGIFNLNKQLVGFAIYNPKIEDWLEKFESGMFDAAVKQSILEWKIAGINKKIEEHPEVTTLKNDMTTKVDTTKLTDLTTTVTNLDQTTCSGFLGCLFKSN